MINQELVLIFVYLLSRFIFYDIAFIINPRSNPKKNISKRLILGLITIVFVPYLDSALIIIFLYSSLIFLDTYLRPKKTKTSKILYLFHLLFALVVIPTLLHYAFKLMPEWDNPINTFFVGLLSSSILIQPLVAGNNFNKALLIFSGYIFTLTEGTIFIRLTLNRIRAVPKKKDKPKQKDIEEYERGKLIGVLERTFFYFLIIFNQIGAVAVIIALKSLARFKELEDKNFAEYFLIGSLLSLLLAAIPAALVRIILIYLIT